MSALDVLLQSLDQAFDKKSWHGTNLRGSLRGVTAREAAWRPAPGRHGIADLALHAAYWKYCVLRRLIGGDKGGFPRPGSNWFTLPIPYAEADWKADLKLLGDTHRALRSAVAKLTPAELKATPKGSTVSNLAIVEGIIAHDLYHAGQIQYVKALLRKHREPVHGEPGA